MESSIDFIVFKETREKIENLSALLKESVKRVVNDENEEFKSKVDSFESNINTIILGGTLGESLSELFDAYNLVGSTSNDKYLLAVEVFGFGDDDTTLSTNKKLILNKFVINSSANINALALAYDNAVQIEYGNQDELDQVKDVLDTQYQKLIQLEVDEDTRLSLLNIRTLGNRFFSSLNLRDVIEFETTVIPSTVLSYKLYKDSSHSDQIVKLNKTQNTGFIEGVIKVLSS